ncbi:MAG: GDPmannose 4,6-dehydratase, partial [Kiritimatiellia bacterium]
MLKAVITGVAGQDGSYLAELLLDKGYQVYGVTRRKSVNAGEENLHVVLHRDGFHAIYGDITDGTFITRLLHDIKPHEYYNLAALSHVGQSFKEPIATFTTNATAVILQLEAIRTFSPATRFYQASTSELFGLTPCPKTGFTEEDAFHPRSPYGVAKLAAYWAAVNAREAWGLHASNGILFNHSSPRRGLDFATRKITRGIAAIKLGHARTLKMGDLSSYRDEGLSGDYMEAAWRMLQQADPGDYVVGTGDGATIEQMFRHVCDLAGLKFSDVYELDERFLRPSEVPYLVANPTKASDVLGWRATHSWRDVLRSMYESDLSELSA